jgi:tetratricopeptide (TPR) repeat protein
MVGRKDIFQNAMNQGHSAAWDQDWTRAVSYYQQALEEFPDHPQALINLGLALYQTQNFEESLKVYLDAARVSPDDPIPMEKISEIYERQGSLGKACEASFRAAELYARSRELDKAIECWNRVARLNPEHLPAHSRLALVHDRLGNKNLAVSEYLAVASLLQHVGENEKAQQTIQRALQISPGNPQISQSLAMIKAGRLLPKPTRPKGATGPLRMAQVRQLDAGEIVGEKTTSEFDPIAEARQKALTVLAGMLFESEEEEPDEVVARKGFQAIVQGMSSAIANQQYDHNRIILHLSQVVDFQTRGHHEEAAKELDKATSLGLDHPAAFFDLGLLQAESKRLESAIRNLKKATMDPDYALGAHLLLGKTYRRMGNVKEAAVEYLRALRLADARVVSESQAESLKQLYAPMIEAQIHETDQEAQVRLCENVEELLLSVNWRTRLEEARRQLPQAGPDSPPLPLAEILTAASSSYVVESLATINQLTKQGRWRSAIDEAFWAIQHAPTYLPLHIYIAEMLVHLDYLEEAITKLEVVARTYGVRGEPQQAVSVLQRVVDLAPMDISVRTRMIEQLIAMHDLPAALQEYMNLANVHYGRAELDKARQTYTDALRLTQMAGVDPSWKVKILHQMADIDLQSLDWRQALRVNEQIRTLKPDDEKARLNLTSLYLRLGQLAQALAELDNYIAYLVEKKQVNRAFAFLESLVDERPEIVPIRHRLAEFYRQTGRIDQALQQYDEIAGRLIDAEDNAGAIKVINRILKLNPPNAAEYKNILEQLMGEI